MNRGWAKNSPIISVAGKTTMEPFKCKSHMTYNEKRQNLH